MTNKSDICKHRFHYKTILLFLFIALSALSISAQKIIAPAAISITYAEKSLDISWDSVPGAIGYNIYNSNKPNTPKSKRLRINNQLIQSGTHFTYLWQFENNQKVRKIKGYNHFVTVTAVFDIHGKRKESGFSEERNNCYFEGFQNMVTAPQIEAVLRDSQQTPLLPVSAQSNGRESFVSFMEGPGKLLAELVTKKLDATETGGCTPVSTILVKLLSDYGISAYRIDGNFIREFHTFAILMIDRVEYVLDFTADQFVPDVIPVLIPRDLCHLNEKGKLSLTGTPVYSIAKLYTPDQIELSEDKSADVYREMYQTVRASFKPY